jgi:hypothetical protein
VTAPATGVHRIAVDDWGRDFIVPEPILSPLVPEGHKESPECYALFLRSCLDARDALAEGDHE